MQFKKILSASFREKHRLKYFNIKIIFGKFIRIFCRPPFPKNLDGLINLHLGCGQVNHPAFINIDAIPSKHIHYVGRIDKISQFEDESVHLIYACHCLEHFSHKKTLAILKEWHRALRKGGVLRVSVPDFDSLVDQYLESKRNIQTVLLPISGGQEYKYNYHMTIFNEDSLRKLFFDAGFSSVKKWLPGSSDMTTFDDWSVHAVFIEEKKFQVSLNLEAIK